MPQSFRSSSQPYVSLSTKSFTTEDTKDAEPKFSTPSKIPAHSPGCPGRIRRELRQDDHLALWSATKDAQSVIPLFIFDETFRESSVCRQLVILDGLLDLRSSLRKLGGELFLRSGEPGKILSSILGETNAAGVYCTKEVHPELRLRDEALRSVVQRSGKIWRVFNDHVLFGEEEILSKAASRPFTVFTAYKNAWKSRLDEIPPSLPRLRAIRVPAISPGELPPAANRAFKGAPVVRSIGGETEGNRALAVFLKKRVDAYGDQRDFPASQGTSRLSHHLASGSLGIRTVYHALRKTSSTRIGSRGGGDTFLNELVWREFYYQILANFPRVLRTSFRPEFDRLKWSSRPALFDSWNKQYQLHP